MQTAYPYFYFKTWKIKAAFGRSFYTHTSEMKPLAMGQLCVSHPTMSSSRSLSLTGIRQLQYILDTFSLTVTDSERESCCMWRVSSSGITPLEECTEPWHHVRHKGIITWHSHHNTHYWCPHNKVAHEQILNIHLQLCLGVICMSMF